MENEIGRESKLTLLSAKLSLSFTVLFLVLLIVLHFIKPEIDPSWRFISEYEIGQYGWIMHLAFFTLAFSQIALIAAIQSQLKNIGGRIGLGLLAINIVGLFLAGIFTSDSIATGTATITKTGQLHNLGGALGIAGLLGTLIISWKLFRNKKWSSARHAILLSTSLVILGFLVSTIFIGIMLAQSSGKFGPNVLVGWPNRFGIAAACVWQIVIAYQAIHLNDKKKYDINKNSN